MPFDVSVTLPFDDMGKADEFMSRAAVVQIAKAAEAAGFHGCSVTDHPAPSNRWLENGGHHAQDPFVLLSMVAAVTEKLRLQTGILVLPYRNPFITARAVSTLDVFSEGRVQLGMGAGYMKKEFAALGMDFDNRNDLMDEYILAMKASWSGEEFNFEGTGYTANGIRVLPAPVQKPHPPLLIGGNSKRAIRRAVDLGDSWYPFLVPKMVTDTARTANLSDEADMRASLDYLQEYSESVGRKTPPSVITSGLFSIRPGWSAQEALDRVGYFRSMGLTGGVVGPLVDSRSQWCDEVQRFGEEVLRKID